VLRLFLVAAALGLSNFAASIGIGLSGVNADLRLRIVVVFGIFETAVPILGLLIGDRLASLIGSAGGWLGGALLILVGAYTLRLSRHQSHNRAPPHSLMALTITGAALSVDNLVIGFALGTQHTSLPLAVLVIGTVSVVMSLAGLELGARLGRRVERRSEELSALVLIAVGIIMTATAF
jgi:putative Mn2+ efflux pump MntP